MRRKDREIGRDDALSIVDQCEWATIAMNDGNEPYHIITFFERAVPSTAPAPALSC